MLVIGGLRRQKHIETTIQAFKKASLERSVLRLVGENRDTEYERVIEKEIAGSPCVERINKRLQYEEFNDYMTKAHFTLFADEKGKSSITNGTMMESLINYTPIIAPDYEPYTYYVKKYGIGLIYKPGDVESYSETLIKAQRLGSVSFIENIGAFQNAIQFKIVANQLYNSISF